MEMQTKHDNSSDDQLRRTLLTKGVEVGPITDTTRQLYENKLRRLLLVEQGGAGTEEPRPRTLPRTSAYVPTLSSDTPLSSSSSSSSSLQSPCSKDNQPISSSDGVVRDLMLQLNNPQHLSNDTAIIFPREGKIVYVCRGLLAIRCAHMTPLLYNLDEPFQVNVVTLTGNASHVMVRSSELGFDLKLKISLLLPGCFPWSLRLLFNDIEIANHLRLDEQNITPGSYVYLVLIEGTVPPPNSVSISAHRLCLTLSVSHLTLGLQPLLEEAPFVPKLEPVCTKQIVLPMQVQHILFVNDAPSLPMKLLLGVLYTGELHIPDIPTEANSSLSLGLCVVLAEYLRTGMTDVCLKAVREKLAQDSNSSELLAVLGRRTGVQVLLDVAS